jgi:hypothetical protein
MPVHRVHSNVSALSSGARAECPVNGAGPPAGALSPGRGEFRASAPHPAHPPPPAAGRTTSAHVAVCAPELAQLGDEAQGFAAGPPRDDSGRRWKVLPRIDRGPPAHSAPLGFHFLEGGSLPSPWGAGGVVAAHGSWDREPPRAPAVLWLPWDARMHPLGTAITLVVGFQEPDGSRWGRSADAVPALTERYT